MKAKKILWPTDFSSSAQNALPHVRSLVEKYRAEIHVLHVVEDIAHHEPWYGEFGEKRVDALNERAPKNARKHLEQICEKYLDGCPLYFRHVAVGDPATEILKLIDAENIDLVVMASHVESGHYRMGSVAEKVAQNAPVPISIIPIVIGMAA